MALELQTLPPTLSRGGRVQPTTLAAAPGPGLRTSSSTSRNARRRSVDGIAVEGGSSLRTASVIASVAGVTVLNTFGQSLLIVAIPQIGRDLHIEAGQLTWSIAVNSLTLGCLLLVVGTIADAVGDRPVFLLGCVLHLLFGLGCALARNASELIASRALQGAALALCMPTAVGIITRNFEEGKKRNIAFACFGGGNPIGYAFGLLLGGIFTRTVGWRYAYYFCLALNCVVLAIAFFSLPADASRTSPLRRLRSSVDWLGLVLISAQLATLSYALASITSHSTLSRRNSVEIALLVVSVTLIPLFILWVGYQARHGRPAIIPNSIWRQTGFSSVCIATFLTWAMFNALAFYATLFMQDIQGLSALQTSLRFLPLVVLSVSANIIVGLLVDKVTASKLAFGATILSAAAPAIFAFTSPNWNYWTAIFPAMCLLPLSSDLLFNVANLVITSSFSSSDQTLAGGVFSTVSQLGSSLGLAVTGAIASSRSAFAHTHGAAAEQAQLEGIRAAFFTCLGAATVSCVISTIGLRSSGKVGLKRE